MGCRTVATGVVSSGNGGTSGDCHSVPRWNSLLKALRSRRARSQNSTNLRGTEHKCLRKNDVKFCDLFFGILRYKVQNLMCNQDARCRCTSVPYHCCGWCWIFHVSMGFRIVSEKTKNKTPQNTESNENRNSKFASQMLRPLCLGDCRRCLTSKVFVTKLSTRNHERNQKKCSNENCLKDFWVDLAKISVDPRFCSPRSWRASWEVASAGKLSQKPYHFFNVYFLLICFLWFYGLCW